MPPAWPRRPKEPGWYWAKRALADEWEVMRVVETGLPSGARLVAQSLFLSQAVHVDDPSVEWGIKLGEPEQLT